MRSFSLVPSPVHDSCRSSNKQRILRLGWTWVVSTTVGAIGLGGLSSATAQALLPDAPSVVSAGGPAGQRASSTVGSADMAGTVLDTTGAAIVGATVTLVKLPEVTEQTAQSDATGHFVFGKLQPGTYQLSVTANGFETIITSEIHLRAGEQHEAQLARMPVGVADTSIEVRVTEAELAKEQISAEVKQRVLGVVPNFYTSFLWNAAPLPAKQKYKLALRSGLDPLVFVAAAGTAELQFATNRYPGYGTDAAAYGKYYGAALADNFTGRMFRSAILPSIFRQDPRYFYNGYGTTKSRLGYALKEAFLTRGDNGHQQPNYSYLLGDFLAAGLSNAYRADQDRRVGLTLENGAVLLVGHIATDIAREFLLNRATTNMPKVRVGRPHAII